MNPGKGGTVHFVGIGGIGMSGIARVLLEMGRKVSGSDLESSNLTRKIEDGGGKVFNGHSPSNLPKDTAVLVYSSSISKTNPELKEAARRGIRVIHRAEMLGELFNARKGIAVTGTHGKTTTTALISVILKKAGLDPTVVIGGEVSEFGGNANLGKTGLMVAEADESDGSFLHLKPQYAVITNIEMEHLDYFNSLEDIMSAYRSFIGNVRRSGKVFYNIDDPNTRVALEGSPRAASSYGLSAQADIRPERIRMVGHSTSFMCLHKGKELGGVRLNVPGRHNVLNALAAISVGLELGIGFKGIASSLEAFTGAKRRFQVRADTGGVMLIEDYAHHPTEIKAVLDACRNWKGRRVIAVFQPHRYSRTKFLAEEFGRCFEGADKLILTDVYAASEEPIEGVSSANIYNAVRKNGLEDVCMMKKEDVADRILAIKRPGDMVLVLGAGDIKHVADELAEKMKPGRKRPSARARRILDKKIMPEFKRLLKGEVRAGESLALRTSFRIGGPAAIWAEPSGTADLKKILSITRSRRIPLFVIGNGTNLLVSDEGFDGVVVRLGSPVFTGLKISGRMVKVGAGHSLPRLINVCCAKGLGGLESLVGIPGTVGGAIYMNAGGSQNPLYRNIGELVASLKVMYRGGAISVLKGADLRFGYRRSNLADYVILEATLKLEKGDSKELTANCGRFIKIKRDKQVLDLPSAGCVFKNTPGSQFTCGQMIDTLGLKGRRVGGAEISAKHANFIVNRGGASCKDVMSLIGLIKDELRKNYGVNPKLEIKVI